MHKTLVILAHDAIDSFEYSPLALHSNAEKYTGARESHEDKSKSKIRKLGQKDTAGSPCASLLLLVVPNPELLLTHWSAEAFTGSRILKAQLPLIHRVLNSCLNEKGGGQRHLTQVVFTRVISD